MWLGLDFGALLSRWLSYWKLTSVISQGSNIYNFKENCTQILCPSIALVCNWNHFALGITQIKKCLNSKANYFQIMSVTGKKIRLPNLLNFILIISEVLFYMGYICIHMYIHNDYIYDSLLCWTWKFVLLFLDVHLFGRNQYLYVDLNRLLPDR